MARPIGYNPEKVLINAMHLFWENGYEATSIKDVVAVTGLKPGSLYNLYGNKEGVFEAVANEYATSSLKSIKEILNKEDDALKNIETFLNEVIIATISNTKTNGCLLVKTLLVIPHKDQKIQKHIFAFFNEIENLLTIAIEKAVKQEKTTVDAKSFAKFIVTTIFGLHAYHKAHQDTKILTDSVKHLLICLENTTLTNKKHE